MKRLSVAGLILAALIAVLPASGCRPAQAGVPMFGSSSSSSSGGSMTLVETKTIAGSAQTTDLTFSGLDGDTDQHYVLYGRGKNGSAGVLELLILPNGTSTNQQGNDVFNGGGAGAVIASLTTIRLLQAAAGTFVTFEAAIEAKRVSGMARHFDVPRYVGQKSASNFMGWGAYWWDDSGAANITSLVIKVNQAGQLDVGSYISLYKRTN